MPLQLDSMQKSLHALTQVLAASENDERISQFSYSEGIAIRARVLIYFEITHGVCRRLIARWPNKIVTPRIADAISRRHLLRLAAENQLTQDADLWMQYDERRTVATHAYDFDKAGSTCNSMERIRSRCP